MWTSYGRSADTSVTCAHPLYAALARRQYVHFTNDHMTLSLCHKCMQLRLSSQMIHNILTTYTTMVNSILLSSLKVTTGASRALQDTPGLPLRCGRSSLWPSTGVNPLCGCMWPRHKLSFCLYFNSLRSRCERKFLRSWWEVAAMCLHTFIKHKWLFSPWLAAHCRDGFQLWRSFSPGAWLDSVLKLPWV